MITIREADSRDIDTLQAIGCATYREHFSSIWSAEGIQQFLDQDFSSAPCKTLLPPRASICGCWPWTSSSRP